MFAALFEKQFIELLKIELNNIQLQSITIFLYNEEFDPGSGWTLAAGLTHASRGAARIACNLVATGARVRNAYATYL